MMRIYGVLNLADFFSSVCKQIWDKQQMNDTADNNLTRQMSFGTNDHRQNFLVLHVPAWMTDGSGSQGSLYLQKKSRWRCSLYLYYHVYADQYSIIAWRLYDSFSDVCCLFISNTFKCNQLNHKAYKESKSGFVSICCEIKIVVLVLGLCTYWLNKNPKAYRRLEYLGRVNLPGLLFYGHTDLKIIIPQCKRPFHWHFVWQGKK